MTQPPDPVRELAAELSTWEDPGRRASSLEVFSKAKETEPSALFAATIALTAVTAVVLSAIGPRGPRSGL